MVNELLELISREENFDVIGQELVRLSGKCFGADFAYVFKFAGNSTKYARKLFSWGVDESLQGGAPFLEESHFGVYRERLKNRQTVLLTPLSVVPDVRQEAELLQKQGVVSRLICGIWSDKRLYGFFGLDWCTEPQVFSECKLNTLKSVVTLFSLSLKRMYQQEQLLESMSHQRQIMDNLPIPILLIDTNYRVRAINPGKKINVDLPLNKLLGSYCYETVCKYGASPEFCAAQETMKTKRPARKEFSFGEKRLIMMSQPIFDRRGRMRYILSVDIDITEVTRQKEELKLAVKQAEMANMAKSYFLATMSHELRTPLNAVIGFSELLQQGDVDAGTRQEYLRSINFAGNALFNLINDVLDLSNLEANKILIAPAKTNLVELIEQITSVFKLKAQQKNIGLTTDTSAIEFPLYVDHLRLRQILLNLIGNAIKFTADGGVSVFGKFTPEDETSGFLELRVSDTGIGISEENREHIFEPFVHDSVIRGRRMYEGSGLGLTISRRLLEQMGGTIRVESEPGKGSTFVVELTVRYERETACPPEAVVSAEPIVLSPGGKRLRVLLVDDVPINLKVLKAMLERLDMICVCADAPEKALYILSQDSDFDLILTDMWMPGLTGSEMARQIRSELNMTNIPVVAITADTQVSSADKEIFAYILLKPVMMPALNEMFKVLGFVQK